MATTKKGRQRKRVQFSVKNKQKSSTFVEIILNVIVVLR